MSGDHHNDKEAMSIYCITLNGPAPWGFRLQGGKDFSMPLTVSRLTPGGKAAQAGVGVGDWVVSIGETNAEDMTHVEAQNKIRAAEESLTLTLSKAFHAGGDQKDSLAPASVQPKYSFAPSAAINKMARPFTPGGGNTVIKPVAYAPKVNTPASAAPASMLQPHNGERKMGTLDACHTARLRVLCDSRRVCIGRTPRAMEEKEDQPLYDHQNYQHEKHGLRVDGIPMFIPNDRSKKRLIEDTQDWQPRTGTTQSRSFRMLAQLTGTDYMQDPDDETMKRAREKFLTEIQSPRYARLRDWHHERSARALNIKSCIKASRSPAKAQTQTADKPDASKAPVNSGPKVRPPWVTDPGFADRYAPDKTSTVLTQHRQPAQPTPMQNRSSILQAAQQAPEDSGRTPLCGACKKIIRGRYLVALGQSWHPEEFQCSQCKVLLDEGGFFEERGSVFCTKCYDNRYAPNCAKCKKIIIGCLCIPG
ncbi:PDZ and LIM domain protein 7-like [Salvelinus namaycush]|uniref:PDZ and LIM domain protein 7 n=1 Tax=Salvelinus namaycush TaxID=8040 RepID=A0A8U0QW30_SALNM|nr:PDZ and LIM domain protein 7-like [Salvelinus namaycush]